MRSRNKEIVLWLSEDEYSHLKKQISKTNLSTQAYLRALIMNSQIKAKPSEEHILVLKELQRVNNCMSQIALKASALNCADVDAYWKNVDELKAVIGNLLEVMYS